MLIIQMLLPRFLVLEGLLFFHILHKSQACNKQVVKDVLTLDSTTSSSVPSPATTSVSPGLDYEDSVVGMSSPCSLDLSAWPIKNVPLFHSNVSRDFILPRAGSVKGQRWLDFTDQRFVISCPGAKVKSVGQKSVPLKCRGDHVHFETESGELLTFQDLSCSRSIREDVRITGHTCGPANNPGKITHIGWKLNKTTFRPQITVCHDRNLAHTLYVNHTIYGKNIEAKETESQRPSYFKEGKFYDDLSADQAYKLKNQKANLKKILGSNKGSEVFNAKTSYFAKGHLAPDADFLFKEWQDATYHFINVAPQWQSFNNGNWKAIENAVRNYASQTKSSLQVFTGTLGTLRYTSDSGSLTKLFLGKGDGSSYFSLIPVPEFFWKLVYNPILDQAIVFVGLNDPYIQGDPRIESQICPDICARHKWFFLYQSQIDKGYTYCCSYQDFKGVIDWVPNIGDPGILDNNFNPLD